MLGINGTDSYQAKADPNDNNAVPDLFSEIGGIRLDPIRKWRGLGEGLNPEGGS